MSEPTTGYSRDELVKHLERKRAEDLRVAENDPLMRLARVILMHGANSELTSKLLCSVYEMGYMKGVEAVGSLAPLLRDQKELQTKERSDD
jgi:hypothetical protein